MRLSDEAIRRIIEEEFQEVLREKCLTTGQDKEIVHRGSGNQKRSYKQITTKQLCDDNITTPTEQAAHKAETERKRKALKKKQETRAKAWRKDKDKQKKSLSRPDQSG